MLHFHVLPVTVWQ